MADLGDKIDTVLSEFRIILPALGAIFGFQLVVGFQPAFTLLPVGVRAASFVGMLCTLLAILFLLVPPSYHRFTPDLDESLSFLVFAQRSISAAFVFLPLSLALSVFVQAVQVFGSIPAAAAVGLLLLAMLVVGWWVVPSNRAIAARVGHR